MYKKRLIVPVLSMFSLCMLTACATSSINEEFEQSIERNKQLREKVVHKKSFRQEYVKDIEGYDILPIDLIKIDNKNPLIVKDATNNIYVYQEVKGKEDLVHVFFDKNRELKQSLFLMIKDLESKKERYKLRLDEDNKEKVEGALKDLNELYMSNKPILNGLSEISIKYKTLKSDFEYHINFYGTFELKQGYGLLKFRANYDYNYDSVKMNLLKYEFDFEEFPYINSKTNKEDIIFLPRTKLKEYVYPYQFSQSESKCEYAFNIFDMLSSNIVKDHFTKYIFCSNAKITDVKTFINQLE